MRSWVASVVLALALPGCSDGPDVEVQAYVGDDQARTDPKVMRENVRAVLQALLRPATEPDPDPEQPIHERVVHPPGTTRELQALIADLRNAPMGELSGPASRLAAAKPAVWSGVRDALLAERKAPKGDYRTVLEVIGGDVPNRYGHFALHWKREHGYDVKLSSDWYRDLLAVPPGRISGVLRPVYRDCVLQVALLRAASSMGQRPELAGEVVATLLDVAYLHHGTFRDEVGRAIRAIGDEAVPHLIAATAQAGVQPLDQPPWEASVAERKAHYARVQLNRMDRLHPSRTVTAVQADPRLLAQVLTAYGLARPGEAAEVLLEHVDAPIPRVREAARRSFLAYVSGPAPTLVRRTVRLLGGQTTEARAYLSYRQRAGLAIRQRLKTEAPSLLEDPCELYRTDGTRDSACEAQPHRLTKAYLAWLDLRRTTRENELIAQALAGDDPDQAMVRIDRLLATNPGLGHTEQLIPFFTQAARSALERGELAEAGQLYRKSALLVQSSDPDRSEALTVEALLAEARTSSLDPAGRRMLLSTAAELAPEDDRVAAGLAALDRDLDGPLQAVLRQALLAFSALVAALACLAMLSARLRRRWLAG